MGRNKKLSRELLGKIERMPQFEERLGIVYENITVNIDDNNEITIFADVRVVDDVKFNKNGSIETKVTLYNEENFILDMQRDVFNVRDFLGLETFRIYYRYNPNYRFKDIEKIRILPK